MVALVRDQYVCMVVNADGDLFHYIPVMYASQGEIIPQGSYSTGISFDLDSFNSTAFPGSPTGGLVSALFSNGATLSGTIGPSQIFVPGFDTFQRGVSARSTTPANPIPEPSEWLAMGMAGASVMGLMIRARRRKSAPA